jgi:thiamine-monophosphate kinase
MSEGGNRCGESELIARYFAPLATAPGARRLVDDAASLNLEPPGDIVLTVDMVVAGIHFLEGDDPASVARKALRVNLSDLAAKGAEPIGYLLALALPENWTEEWLAEFCAGLADDQMRFGLSLYGGDTVRTTGPLTISITAFGAPGQSGMLRRDGAVGEGRVLVSGTIGDAALGLKLATGQARAADWGLDPEEEAFLCDRYRCPRPRLDLVPALRKFAIAAMDISDGLVGDLEKMCAASGVGARVDAARVPLSPAAQKALAADPALLEVLLGGGDDYEILACVDQNRVEDLIGAAKVAGVALNDLGAFTSSLEGVRVNAPDGGELKLRRGSFTHF